MWRRTCARAAHGGLDDRVRTVGALPGDDGVARGVRGEFGSRASPPAAERSAGAPKDPSAGRAAVWTTRAAVEPRPDGQGVAGGVERDLRVDRVAPCHREIDRRREPPASGRRGLHDRVVGGVDVRPDRDRLAGAVRATARCSRGPPPTDDGRRPRAAGRPRRPLRRRAGRPRLRPGDRRVAGPVDRDARRRAHQPGGGDRPPPRRSRPPGAGPPARPSPGRRGAPRPRGVAGGVHRDLRVDRHRARRRQGHGLAERPAGGPDRGLDDRVQRQPVGLRRHTTIALPAPSIAACGVPSALKAPPGRAGPGSRSSCPRRAATPGRRSSAPLARCQATTASPPPFIATSGTDALLAGTRSGRAGRARLGVRLRRSAAATARRR